MSQAVPNVTIGILCYNAEETIIQAVTSAASQDYQNFEIIVVDDASTDQSVCKLQSISKDIELKLVRHETNQGAGAARNSVIKAAKGEFVVFFDDDDISHPKRIETQLETILTYEERYRTDKIACYASGRRTYPNGYYVKSQAIGSHGNTPPNGPDMARYLLVFHRKKDWFYGSGTPTSSLMIRRDLIVHIGGFDACLKRVEDIDLAIRLALIGCYFVGSPDPLVERRMTDFGYKSPESNLKAEQHLVLKYKDFLTNDGLFYHAYHWPKLRYHHFKKEYLHFIFKLIGLFVHNPIRTTFHLFATGPSRVIHELKINAAPALAED